MTEITTTTTAYASHIEDPNVIYVETLTYDSDGTVIGKNELDVATEPAPIDDFSPWEYALHAAGWDVDGTWTYSDGAYAVRLTEEGRPA